MINRAGNAQRQKAMNKRKHHRKKVEKKVDALNRDLKLKRRNMSADEIEEIEKRRDMLMGINPDIDKHKTDAEKFMDQFYKIYGNAQLV